MSRKHKYIRCSERWRKVKVILLKMIREALESHTYKLILENLYLHFVLRKISDFVSLTKGHQ